LKPRPVEIICGATASRYFKVSRASQRRREEDEGRRRRRRRRRIRSTTAATLRIFHTGSFGPAWSEGELRRYHGHQEGQGGEKDEEKEEGEKGDAEQVSGGTTESWQKHSLHNALATTAAMAALWATAINAVYTKAYRSIVRRLSVSSVVQ